MSGFQNQNDSSYTASSANSISNYSSSVKISKRLNTFIDLPLETSLMTVLKIIKEFSSLLAKNRDAKLNEEEIWITNSGGVIILSDVPQNSKSQYFRPTVRQETKIGKKIMEIVSRVSEKKFEDFYTYYQRSLAKHPDCDFKHINGLIKSYCACAKIQLS